MSRLKGIAVVLIQKHKAGEDPFGAPVYEEEEVTVENVLIAPLTSEDAASHLNLTGRRAAYTLGIPKGDKHNWEDCEVRFFGQRFRTFGIPTQGIEEMMPLTWNKKVMVERYE